MYYGQIRNVQGGGSGKTCTIVPGRGATYDKFILKLGGGLVAADLTEIRIIADDGEVFKDSGTNLDLRQAYKGIDTDVGEVVIDFTEPGARGAAAEQYLASLPANLLKNLKIEVDIADNEGVGEDFTQLSCAAEFRGPTQNPFILKRRRFTFPFSAAGDLDMMLPSGISGGIIKRVWLHDGGHTDAAILRIGNRNAWEFKTIAENTRVQERNRLTPQANITCLDFVADGNLGGALNTSKTDEVILTVTADASYNYVVYVDYIDPVFRAKS